MNKKQYQSLLIIVLGFLALGFIFDKLEILKLIALAIGATSLIIPPLGKLILKTWNYLAMGLGWVNSRILLTLVFFVILTPIALISRLFSGDKLQLKRKERATMWATRNHVFTPKDLENPW